MNEDPVRLLSSPDPPAHFVELARRLEPPPLPPRIRASARARLPGKGFTAPWRIVGPTLAVATMVGIGVVTWWLRQTEPQPLPEPVVAITPERSAPDASVASETPLELGQIAPPPEPSPPEIEIVVAGPRQSYWGTPGPVVRPGVDASAVRSVVAPRMSDLQHCLRDAAPSGETRRFGLELVIAASGRVTHARFAERVRVRGVRCALAIARAWRFPEGPNDTRAQIPIVVRGEASTPPEAGPPARTGRVLIRTQPWARVFLDGSDTNRTTPVSFEVSAGHHVLGLSARGNGPVQDVQVEVRSGQTVRIVRSLGESPSVVSASGAREDRARECTGRSDNRCVIELLEGRAESASQLALLIEAYRAEGDPRAQEHMRAYVSRYPDTPRAAAYRHILSRSEQPSSRSFDEDE